MYWIDLTCTPVTQRSRVARDHWGTERKPRRPREIRSAGNVARHRRILLTATVLGASLFRAILPSNCRCFVVR